jgi:small neutral amino acid transporter SnatA (MarC family)
MKYIMFFFLVVGLFLIIWNFIDPNNLVPVFAAVIVGTDEEDEIKGTSKKVAYSD